MFVILYCLVESAMCRGRSMDRTVKLYNPTFPPFFAMLGTRNLKSLRRVSGMS